MRGPEEEEKWLLPRLDNTSRKKSALEYTVIQDLRLNRFI